MTITHRCADCEIAPHATAADAAAAGQRLLYRLLLDDDGPRWREHLTADGRRAIARVLDRGPQIVVTSHERPLREIQALALLLRNAGMPLRVLVNDGTTRVPVAFALTGRSPLHLVNALGALRGGDSVLFVLWRAPMRPRGLLPWEAPHERPRPAVGPVVLARRTGLPITLGRLHTAGRRAARIELVEQRWHDGGASLEDEARRLTEAVDPVLARAG